MSGFALDRKMLTRLTSAPGISAYRHVWTRNGKHILYRTDGGIFAVPADGSRAPQQITKDPADYPASFSPDSAKFYFGRGNQHRVVDLDWSDPMQAKVGKEAVVPIAFVTDFEISPDGRWIAYVRAEGNVPEAYVRPLDTENGGKWQISASGASIVRWSPNGRELFFGDLDRRAHVVSYSVAGETFVPGQPKRWEMPGREESMFGFATDGKRVLYPTNVRGGDADRTIVFELNFSEELRQRKDLAPN